MELVTVFQRLLKEKEVQTMNIRIMRGTAVLALITVVALLGLWALGPQFAPSTAQAGGVSAVNSAQATTDVNTGITVSGEGKASVKPNIAIATIGVDITTVTLNDATTQANTKMAAVIDKLKSMGVDDKDIQTSNYSLYPITAPSPKGPEGSTPPSITGYRVTNQVRVTIRKITDVGKLLDSAVTAGANNIYGVSFSVDDLTPFQQQARAAAIKDAQDKAGQLAKDAGVALGPVIAITEGSAGPVPMPAAAVRFASGASDVPIQTGDMQVVVDVGIRFGIK